MTTDPLLFRVTAETEAVLRSPGLADELSAVVATGRREWVGQLAAGSPEAVMTGRPWSDHVARAVLDWLIGRCTVETAPHYGQSRALELICAERLRQFENGYDARHDDALDDAQLVEMALWYADDEASVMQWPWYDDWPERGDRGRDLVRAASLLAAEIDRLLRGGWRP